MLEDQNLAADGLERYRNHLALLARLRVSPRLRDKIDLSGVVQLTMLEAWRAGPQLAGYSEEHRLAWLRSALTHNLADALRKLGTARRNVAREQSLVEAEAQSSARPSPSQQIALQELLVRLRQSLAQLPENQRRAVEMHHLQGRPVAEVAEALGSSKPAVVGLVHRGLVRLRELLNAEEK